MKQLPDTIEDRLAQTFFIVKATSFEHSSLWLQYAKDGEPRLENALDWKQISDGRWIQLGVIDNRPIIMSFYWAWIDGFLICFYDGTSQLFDWKMADEFLEKHFKGKWDRGTRRAECNAMNFHHVINAILDGEIELLAAESNKKE